MEYWLSILTFSCLGIIMAWGIYLPLRGGVFVFGQYGFVSVGAYVAAMSTLSGWPLGVSLILGTVASTVAAFLIGIPSLRVKGVGVAIVTIGFAEIVKVFWINTDKFLPLAGGPMGLMVPTKTTLWMVAITVAILFILLSRLEHSKLGRAMDAIRGDEVAAEAMGVNLVSTKLFSITASGFLCGIAGSFLAHHIVYIEPDYFGFPLLVNMVVYAMLGGLGTVWGAVIGALSFNIILELLGFAVGWRVFIGGLILVLVLLFRPSGILSKKALVGLEQGIGQRLSLRRATKVGR